MRVLLLILTLLLPLLHGCSTPLILATATAGGVAVAHDKRSAGNVIDDQIIEANIYNNLHAEEQIKTQAHINVTVYNGIVLLTGEAPTEVLRKQAEAVAREAKGVRRVYNEVVIAEPTTLASRSYDTWLTTKVKTRLLKEESVEGSQIKVITENSTVFLMGLIDRAQAQRATDLARNTGGVKMVVRAFEYTD